MYKLYKVENEFNHEIYGIFENLGHAHQFIEDNHLYNVIVITITL